VYQFVSSFSHEIKLIRILYLSEYYSLAIIKGLSQKNGGSSGIKKFNIVFANWKLKV